MKNMKLNKALLIVCALFLASACINDKGNYDYRTDKPLKITGLPDKSEYDNQSVLKIEPTIENLSAKDEYRFLWITKVENKRDTVGKERNLEVMLVYPPAKEVELLYVVTNLRTGVSDFARGTFTTKSIIPGGWFILKDQDGFTEIDNISKETVGEDEKTIPGTVTENLIYGYIGEKMEGNAIGFSHGSFRINLTNIVPSIQVASENDIKLIRYADFTELRDFNQNFIFPPAVRDVKFYNYVNTAFNPAIQANPFSFIINDGKVHFLGYLGQHNCQYASDGVYSKEELKLPLEVELFPSIISGIQSFKGFALLYDVNNKVFLGWNTDDAKNLVKNKDEYTPEQLKGAEMIWMGQSSGLNTFSPTGYVLMKKGGTTYLADVSVSGAAENMTFPVVEKLEKPHELAFANSDYIIARQEHSSSMLYYAKDNAVYAYRRNSLESTEIYKFDVGSKITFMQHNTWNDSIELLTSKDGKWHLYRIGITGGGEGYGAPVKFGEGTGTGRSAIYVN